MAVKKSQEYWGKEAKKLQEKLQVNKPLPDTHIMTFGKYKGKTLKEVPEEYLMWLYTESDLVEKARLFLHIDLDLDLIMGLAHENRNKKSS